MTISFSEEVYIIENLKNATFPKFISTRLLQEIIDVPYIDISIEPGDPTLENLDLTKYTFTYDAAFVDSKTIMIKVYFDNAVYISAG